MHVSCIALHPNCEPSSAGCAGLNALLHLVPVCNAMLQWRQELSYCTSVAVFCLRQWFVTISLLHEHEINSLCWLSLLDYKPATRAYPCTLLLRIPMSTALWQGYGAVRELENVATDSGDKPTHECFIKDCGELPPGASTNPPLQVTTIVVTICAALCSITSCILFRNSSQPRSFELQACSCAWIQQ